MAKTSFPYLPKSVFSGERVAVVREGEQGRPWPVPPDKTGSNSKKRQQKPKGDRGGQSDGEGVKN